MKIFSFGQNNWLYKDFRLDFHRVALTNIYHLSINRRLDPVTEIKRYVNLEASEKSVQLMDH